MRPASRGMLYAILAYLCWGYLSPGGKLLLEATDPFTLNSIRTLIALPILAALLGWRATREAGRLLRTDLQVWILGVVWLAGTFIPYLWSLKFLPPTFATLTIYFAPLVIAAWQRFVWKQPISPWAVPAVLLTLVGGFLTTRGAGGFPLDGPHALGIGLVMISVFGWAAYTIHIKWLTATRDAHALTIAAFAASALTFTAGAIFEGFRFEWSPRIALLFAGYVLVPTVLAFWLYTLALKYSDAETVAVLLGVELVSTAIFSYFITGEEFGTFKITGLGLAVLAVSAYLVDAWWRERRRSRTKNPPNVSG